MANSKTTNYARKFWLNTGGYEVSMALISVTEAARLTGKNRATIHRYIKQGKL